jgi:SAM-dependent methyltransferase
MSEAPYDLIASEYYLAEHQTSRNFDQTTAVALALVRARVPAEGLVLDVGAGRGRCCEFLRVDPSRVIQLDNSDRMLEVHPREACALRVLQRAESLPFLGAEFACVTAFLCDPFLGLEFLAESYRVLRRGGILIATTPAYEWGAPLRKALGISTNTTRFITKEGIIVVPSVIVPQLQLTDMLRRVGFDQTKLKISRHRLPQGAEPISQDISAPASAVGCNVHELDILYCIIAEK